MRYPAVKVLSAEECWERLRVAKVGRLAIGGSAHPELFPINYLVDRGTILFRTDPGTKLAASLDRSKATFEADGVEPGTNEAWSVVIKGVLEVVTGAEDIVDALSLPLSPWQYGPKAFHVRVVPEELSGRRFVVVDPAHWISPPAGVHRVSRE